VVPYFPLVFVLNFSILHKSPDFGAKGYQEEVEAVSSPFLNDEGRGNRITWSLASIEKELGRERVALSSYVDAYRAISQA
jgi:hypothetical protein